ncbi:MAG: hypothetical protein R3330_09480 [Saprospiraceae bacterium]|nr:hypothetical protein [Saprospiraceae bacterium]
MQRLKMHRTLTILTIAIGVVLMIYMIVVEDEPGAIPLLLIAVGAGWFFGERYRGRSQHK